MQVLRTQPALHQHHHQHAGHSAPGRISLNIGGSREKPPEAARSRQKPRETARCSKMQRDSGFSRPLAASRGLLRFLAASPPMFNEMLYTPAWSAVVEVTGIVGTKIDPSGRA